MENCHFLLLLWHVSIFSQLFDTVLIHIEKERAKIFSFHLQEQTKITFYHLSINITTLTGLIFDVIIFLEMPWRYKPKIFTVIHKSGHVSASAGTWMKEKKDIFLLVKVALNMIVIRRGWWWQSLFHLIRIEN